MDDSYDYLFKVLVIGDVGVGKSSLLLRFTEGTFSETAVNIQNDFKSKTLIINDQKVKLQIWDTAGQERFRTVTASYYRGAHGILLVYDMTSQESFDNIKEWKGELETMGNPEVAPATILVGNKVDLGDNKRVITTEQAKEYMIQEKFGNFMETSAKNNIKVDEMFEKIANGILRNHNGEASKAGENLVDFGAVVNKDKKSSKCC
eukprot:CAMPEP_0201522118 /NCGR_PEP_ID=MMETSP0161_2-20130828/16467_1 /ASSEMBLY_ACC=CAM_ASM_000251 /TAXON_ID=180227 /ORGANISM="Neoparamoeba aestuarina, Strain SoJaBio B1-5/56/2" /LENGTH=204 /DNA_ID=CAMNT_0047920883 /DNA_START=115 /DNA_END=729 /DNA_ORIENTATION=-